MNKRYFTRWLRSKQLPLLLSFMLVAMAAVQSLHEQLEHNGEVSVGCEYCLMSQTADSGLVPLAISLPIVIADYIPAIFVQGLVPLAVDCSFSPRGPPVTFVTF
jgi:hypothetical protein